MNLVYFIDFLSSLYVEEVEIAERTSNQAGYCRHLHLPLQILNCDKKWSCKNQNKNLREPLVCMFHLNFINLLLIRYSKKKCFFFITLKANEQ